MKFSIFTPTHNPEYIQDCYNSLLRQSLSGMVDWEWIIVANGENKNEIYNKLIDELTYYDSRVKVFVYDSDNVNIGALKHFACSLCKGDYLIELDHDDKLTDYALYEIDKAATLYNSDFIYSDFCNFDSDNNSHTYGKEYGWDTYPFKYRGIDYIANKAIPVSPRALYEIFFAPNHIRVWKKDFYDKVGGHDSSLKVCDDHDLLCRTYLNDAIITYINEPLYMYRLQDNNNNSYLQMNAEIQIKQQEIGNKYFYSMVEKWSDKEGLLKLDLGAAHNPKSGYLSVDMVDGVDCVCDVTKGLPFEDNSVGVIRAYDFLEHIQRADYEFNLKDYNSDVYKTYPFMELINEIYRVLAPGGWLLTATPIGNTRSYMADPSHVNPICAETFQRFCIKDKQKYNPQLTCKFQDVRIWEYGDYVMADLQALKGQYTCGLVKI